LRKNDFFNVLPNRHGLLVQFRLKNATGAALNGSSPEYTAILANERTVACGAFSILLPPLRC